MSTFLKALVIVLFCISSSFGAEYTIKLTHVVSPDTPKGKGADFLAKRVRELTNGRVEVIVYPNSQLYGDGEEIKA